LRSHQGQISGLQLTLNQDQDCDPDADQDDEKEKEWKPPLTGQESNMRLAGKGSNASHPQPISSKHGGGKGNEARKSGNLPPSLQAPVLEQQELERMLDEMQAPGAHADFVGPVRGQGEVGEACDLVVTSAGPHARSTPLGNDSLGPLERAVKQALELHPSLRPSPVPRIFIKGQHESSRVLSLPQPLVLAAAKVFPPFPPSHRCHVLLHPVPRGMCCLTHLNDCVTVSSARP